MKNIFTILIFLLAAELIAQTHNVVKMPGQESRLNQDISVLQQAFSAKPKARLTEQYTFSRDNSNELQMVLSGLFLVYKSFLSSQDNQRCSFHPSCSEYGLEAVKKFGILRGIVSTCDRLTRCNGFSPEQYEIDLERRVLKDPVRW